MHKNLFVCLLLSPLLWSSLALGESYFTYSYDKKDVISYEAKEPKASLLVYTDIDCGFCRKLHKEIPDLNASGISVYYSPFPRSGLNRKSHRAFQSVYCAEDRKKALTKAKNGFILAKAKCDIDPTPSMYEDAKTIGVKGTPTMLTNKGETIVGFKTAQVLAQTMGVEYVRASEQQHAEFAPLNFQTEEISESYYQGLKSVPLYLLPSREQKRLWKLSKNNIRVATVKTVVDGEEWIGFENKGRTYYGLAEGMQLLGLKENYETVDIPEQTYLSKEKARVFIVPDSSANAAYEISANRTTPFSFKFKNDEGDWLGYSDKRGFKYFVQADKFTPL